MKVGIIGCGKIADEHASAVQTLGRVEIVGNWPSDSALAGILPTPEKCCDRVGRMSFI
jgi:predicted dehydrogenase